jgi:predicted Zn-dependent protease
LAVLKKAQAIAEDSFEVPYSIAVIYDNVGRYDEAAQILQDLLKRTEKPDGSYTTPEANNRSIFLERLGTVYRDQNKTQLALDTFRKMVALGDDSASRGYQQLVETIATLSNGAKRRTPPPKRPRGCPTTAG